MNEKNTYKEHLQDNEKEQNVKNLVFDPCQVFKPCQNFVESHHSRYRRHFLWKLYGPTPVTPKFDPLHPRTHNTHATHAI